MTLKPKATPFLLAILGGVVFIVASLGFMVSIHKIEWVAVLMTLVGCVLSFIGVHMLLTSNSRTINVDPSGITVNRPKEYLHLSAEQITLVAVFSSPERPAVEITVVGGKVLHIDCRLYCKPSVFVQHCRNMGLPCA